MICSPCRKAGELNKMLGTNRDMTHVEKMIHKMHDNCPKGNWCDCQHVIGPVLNPERVVVVDRGSE